MERYQLYGRRQTGVMAIEAALGEADVPFDYVDLPVPVSAAEKDRFGRLNPRLQVPILIHPDGTIITEGPAMLYHIADAFPAAALAARPGSAARAAHDRWLSFFHANVYEGMLRELKPGRYTDDPASAPAVMSAATGYVRRHFLIFEDALADGPYWAGDAVTTLDIYLWMLCYWIDAAWLAAHCPRIARLWRTAESRPILSRIARDHFG